LGLHSRPGARIPALHPQAAQLLLTYSWPGNVRELENVMQRALVLCDGDLIRDAHIVFEPASAEPAIVAAMPAAADAAGNVRTDGALADSLAQIEQKLILQALRTHDCRGRAAGYQPAHAALQAGASARGRRSDRGTRLARGLCCPREQRMSDMSINAVLAQIRSLSAQAGSNFNGGTGPLGALRGLAGAAGDVDATGAAGAAQGAGFAQMLKEGIDAVNSTQQKADALANAWERGDPGVDLARVMVETQKASVSFQALAQVRNRLVSVYQDIMNMSI
jgi:flagellar hook-basal body complex protein FliE